MNVVIISLIFVLVAYAIATDLEITIKQGTLRGKERVSRNGRTFKSYTAIPYAEPPINKFRFQRAIPANPWKGVLDATKEHPRCLQIYSYLKNYTYLGSENCLYLNVYTPNTQPAEKLPVMVFIHGGGFITGSALDYDPSLLMDHDVVLVTINYRLGPFGFFPSIVFSLSGNEGLKDQVVALRWVKDNIADFGGNPNKITVFGQGAGGISAHLHMLSPLSKNLINGVIAQSGTAVAHNVFMPFFLSSRFAKFLAERLDCPTDDKDDEMTKCMLYKNGKKILEKTAELTDWDIEPITVFKPVIESNTPDAFIFEDPVHIILKGKAANVPFMTGITTDEGDLRTTLMFNNTEALDSFNKNMDTYLPSFLHYNNMAIYKNIKPATDSIKNFYLKNKNVTKDNKSYFSKMVMDSVYLHGANLAVDVHSETSKKPVYYYVLGYKGSESYCKLNDPTGDDYGVCHLDDLLYLFNDQFNFPEYKRSEDDNKVADLMTTLWVKFAQDGNLNETVLDGISQWEPFTTHQPNYYFIKNGENVENLSVLFKNRTNFWKNLKINEERPKIKDEL